MARRTILFSLIVTLAGCSASDGYPDRDGSDGVPRGGADAENAGAESGGESGGGAMAGAHAGGTGGSGVPGGTDSGGAGAGAAGGSSAGGSGPTGGSGGSGPAGGSGGTDTGGSGSAGDDPAQYCVDTINSYRATLGLTAYARWISAEACTDSESESDSISGVPHGAFGQCGEWAQNECPGWAGPLTSLIDACFEMMWAEGPGADYNLHGHYLAMSSTQYTKVACGFFKTPSGRYWAIQNFK